jgi:hypothetical protein
LFGLFDKPASKGMQPDCNPTTSIAAEQKFPHLVGGVFLHIR